MSIQLREPPFLRGRRSVLQRAVIMSMVLGGLAAVAGWILASVAIFGGDCGGSVADRFVIPAIWSLAATSLICAPLNSWNARSRQWTLLALPVTFVLLFLERAWGLSVLTYAGRQFVLMRVDGYEVRLFAEFFLVLVGSGLLLVRASRTHLIAFLVSISAALVPTLIVRQIVSGDGFQILENIPGFPNPLIPAIYFATYYGSLFVAFSVPWGIPFWWPPESEESLVETS